MQPLTRWWKISTGQTVVSNYEICFLMLTCIFFSDLFYWLFWVWCENNLKTRNQALLKKVLGKLSIIYRRILNKFSTFQQCRNKWSVMIPTASNFKGLIIIELHAWIVQGVLALCEFHYCEFHYCGFSKLFLKFG